MKNKESTYEDLFLQLPVEARIVLRCYTEQFRTEEVAEEQLIVYLQNKTALSGLKCLLALARLEASQLLMRQTTLSDDYIYRMPLTVYFYLQKKWQQSDVVYATDEMIEQMWLDGELFSSAKPLSAQLFVFLTAVGKSKMELNHKKQFPKKWIEQVAAKCHITDELLMKNGVDRRGTSSLLIDMLLQLSLRLQIITLVDTKLEWNDTAFIQWLRMQESEREKQLQLLLFEWLLDNSAVQSYQLAYVYNLEVDRWAVTSNAAIHSVLQLLHAVGLVEIVQLATNPATIQPYYFRKSIENNSGVKQMILQENGDIIIDRHNYWLRWELELVAECTSEEEWVTYRFSASSLALAVEQGRQQEQLLTFLQQHAATVPAVFMIMMQQWMPASSSPYVVRTLLLNCQSCYLADRLEQLAEEHQLQLMRIGEQHFVLEEQHIPTVRKWLQQLEHPLKKISSVSPSLVITYPNYRMMEQQLEFDTRAVALPELELDVMINQEQGESTLQIVLEELEQLPRHWTEKLQNYHPSTRKQMIEQAIRCRTEVLLRVEDRLVTFVPQAVVEQSSGWEVIGCYVVDDREEDQHIVRQVVKLADDAWQAIQIIKPSL